MKSDRPAMGWKFDNGQEFPGARGGLEVDSSIQYGGGPSLKLAGDFTGGGNYVQVSSALGGEDVREFSFWVRNLNDDHLGIRMIDSTGRCHQFRLKAEATGGWQKISLPLETFFRKQATAEAVESVKKYEAWGGDKNGDGKWKGPGRSVAILIGKTPTEKVRTIWLNGIAVIPSSPQAGAKAFQADFETGQALEGWIPHGGVSLDSMTAFGGRRSLVLEKNEKTLRDDVSIVGPVFPAFPGKWDIHFAGKSELKSHDSSYNGGLEFEALDVAGKVLSRNELGILFGDSPWKAVTVQRNLPEGTVSARFVARLNKETIGKFWLDELSAAALARAGDERISRIMFSTAQLGNLLYPADPREVKIEVWASRSLDEEQMEVSWRLKDYWGNEQNQSSKARLKEVERKGDLIRYEGRVDLASIPMEIGKYYEIHASITRKSEEPFSNYSSLAILPEAPANQFRPDEIPFTSRNWDNRIEDYVRLTHRLGIRICGVWGKMDADPAKNEAPQLDLVRELGMGFLTGSPAHFIEERKEGYEKLTEEVLRQSVRIFIAKYGQVRPMIVNLGNEPHARGEAVKTDVEAYRIIYSEIKKIDPSIFVVGTSVGLEEENYFKFGFGKWCDAYDFHSYESPEGVYKILKEGYPEMFKKYGEAKPVWATEIGLNSQGLSRYTAASTLYRKFAWFFAGGGANVSWFDLLYPDKDGTAATSSGSAHNVFDCRYNRYAPKLDAIAYYNAVNSISSKKFVDQRTYGKDTHIFLFRDKKKSSLLICFKDKGREDVFLPMPGAGNVEVIRIDGGLQSLDAAEVGLTLTLNEDPILLLYEGSESGLPEKLGTPAFAFSKVPGRIDQGKDSIIDFPLGSIEFDRLLLHAPLGWTVKKSNDGEAHSVARFTVRPPEGTTAREADFMVDLDNGREKSTGALFYRAPIGAMVALQMSISKSAVTLEIKNLGALPQEIAWEMNLKIEKNSTKAYFSEPASGILVIGGKQSREVTVPVVGVDGSQRLRVQAIARDHSERMTDLEKDWPNDP